MPNEILAAISEYARAYRRLDDIQQSPDSVIPPGDQKTGPIGEFYSYVYLKQTYADCSLTYGNHSQPGWDIRVRRIDHPDILIQTKTVSEYNKRRRITPIHHGWDQLLVLYVSRSFQPLGFWIVTDSSIVTPDNSLVGRCCPNPDRPRTGSPTIDFGTNRVSDLLAAVETYGARQVD